MAGNPLVPQGVLNRARGSITFNAFPTLNITAPYLGVGGISLSFAGPNTSQIGSMTGVVQSPELMQIATLRVNLLKTQLLANLFKQQGEVSGLLGDCIVYPDVQVNGIGSYPITNCAMGTLETLTFNGTDAGWILPITGVYLINNSLFGG